MATPSWDDINKLQEQNIQMWMWIGEQKTYIKALMRAIPEALMEDLASTLPSLPDIPESLALWQPRRILNSPIDDSRPFNITFPDKPMLPPRDSSTTAMKLLASSHVKRSNENDPDEDTGTDILDHYPVSATDDSAPQTPMQEHEMLYLAYESSKDGDGTVKGLNMRNKIGQDSLQKSTMKDSQTIFEKEEQDYKIEVLYTTRALTPKGKEAMALILSVVDNLKNEEVCKLDKQYSHLAILDVYIRKKDPNQNFPSLPEKFLFQTFSPYKFDARKNAVEFYLNFIISNCGGWKEVKNFIRTNRYEPVKSFNIMEGFLFKREKQGASWKARYHYIKDGFLGFADRQGEPEISSIDLKNMTVSRMSDVPSPTENDHCHAFILYESKSSNTDINQEKQHLIFSCENDKERDLWVLHLANEILKYRPKDRMLSKELSDIGFKNSIPSRSSSKESNDLKSSASNPSGISPIADIVGEISLRKKSDHSDVKSPMGKYFKSKANGMMTDKPLPQTKKIFGSHLADAVAISQISKNLPIPAIVYRCIDYLEQKKVWEDEGIYRLSGMSTEISYLKGKFEADLDYDLLHQDEAFDTNAVAGLLKLYLRELPAPLFPENEIKTTDGKSNLENLQIGLSKIPYLNYVLLKTIFGHLALIASHSSVNKMSPQNLSIIFSPTLQLSPAAFSLFLLDFASVFSREDVRSQEDS